MRREKFSTLRSSHFQERNRLNFLSLHGKNFARIRRLLLALSMAVSTAKRVRMLMVQLFVMTGSVTRQLGSALPVTRQGLKSRTFRRPVPMGRSSFQLEIQAQSQLKE